VHYSQLDIELKMAAAPRLVHNIAALVSVQAIGYVVPLLTLPYVTRVLGAAGWGTVAWTQIVLGYFALLTNWGFLWSGTRKVARLRNDPGALSNAFFAILTAQCFLGAAAISMLLFLILLVPFFHQLAAYYLFGIGVIAGNVLFPIWFLNGLEMMRQVANVQILTRLAAVPLVFLIVRKPDDAPLVIAIYATTNICGGFFVLLWIRKNLNLIWRWPRRTEVIAELKEGGVLFSSTAWIGLYTTLTPTVLGIVAGPAVVGYYALADRLRQLAQSVMKPVSDSLFPRMSHLFASDATDARRLLVRSCAFILPVAALTSVALWGLAGPIVQVLAGAKFKAAVPVLRWLAPLPLVISLSNIFGVQIMLPRLKTKAFNLILAAAGMLSLVALLPLIHWWGAEGAAMNCFGVECFVTISMGLYLWKTGFFGRLRPLAHQ
jgi:O-antigen/teichoic acid export membrane protein